MGAAAGISDGEIQQSNGTTADANNIISTVLGEKPPGHIVSNYHVLIGKEPDLRYGSAVTNRNETHFLPLGGNHGRNCLGKAGSVHWHVDEKQSYQRVKGRSGSGTLHEQEQVTLLDGHRVGRTDGLQNPLGIKTRGC